MSVMQNVKKQGSEAKKTNAKEGWMERLHQGLGERQTSAQGSASSRNVNWEAGESCSKSTAAPLKHKPTDQPQSHYILSLRQFTKDRYYVQTPVSVDAKNSTPSGLSASGPLHCPRTDVPATSLPQDRCASDLTAPGQMCPRPRASDRSQLYCSPLAQGHSTHLLITLLTVAHKEVRAVVAPALYHSLLLFQRDARHEPFCEV